MLPPGVSGVSFTLDERLKSLIVAHCIMNKESQSEFVTRTLRRELLDKHPEWEAKLRDLKTGPNYRIRVRSELPKLVVNEPPKERLDHTLKRQGWIQVEDASSAPVLAARGLKFKGSTRVSVLCATCHEPFTILTTKRGFILRLNCQQHRSVEGRRAFTLNQLRECARCKKTFTLAADGVSNYGRRTMCRSCFTKTGPRRQDADSASASSQA